MIIHHLGTPLSLSLPDTYDWSMISRFTSLIGSYLFWTLSLGSVVVDDDCDVVGMLMIACSQTLPSSRFQTNILKTTFTLNMLRQTFDDLLSTNNVVFFKKHCEVGYLLFTLTMNFLNSPHCSLWGLWLVHIVSSYWILISDWLIPCHVLSDHETSPVQGMSSVQHNFSIIRLLKTQEHRRPASQLYTGAGQPGTT